MDAISYSYADKQAKRIKKFIENPDSSSGIVTVPKTIASGETVTIPAGRVAVLPNLQIDGTLDIQGDVFIPSGSTFGDLDSQIALKANIDSPALTGTPIAPTPTAQDNSTKIATTAYVDGKMVLGTAVNATGTAIDFTGIPNWVKRITIMFNGVSTNGTSPFIIQLGNGTIETSGYTGQGSTESGSSTVLSSGFFAVAYPGTSTLTWYGVSVVNIIGGTTYLYTSSLGSSLAGTNAGQYCQGKKITSAILDRIRITTVNGTDTFDAGQINIMYEG